MKKDINNSDNLNKTAASNQTSEVAAFHATYEKNSGMTTDALIQTADVSNPDILIQFINQGNELANKLKPFILLLIIMSYILYLFLSFSTDINGGRIAGLSNRYEALQDKYQLTENNTIDKHGLSVKDLNNKDYLRKNRKDKQLLGNKMNNPADKSGMLTCINNYSLKDSFLLYDDNNLEIPKLNISSLNSNYYTYCYDFGNDYNSWSAIDTSSVIKYKDIWYKFSVPQQVDAGSFSSSLLDVIHDIYSQSEIRCDDNTITCTTISTRITSLPDLKYNNWEDLQLLPNLNQSNFNLILSKLSNQKIVSIILKDITGSTIVKEDLFDLHKNNINSILANARLKPGWYTLSFITNSNTISERILIPKN